MKFKTLSILFAAAALSLTACKDDVMPGGDDNNNGANGNGSGKVYYVSAGIALPNTNTGRSATDAAGDTNSDADKDFEYGYDYENDVRTVILVIADKNDKYIAHTVVSDITEAPASGSKFDFMVTGEIKYEDLEAAYGDGGLLATDPTVHIFAICNYTQDLLNKFKAEGNKDNWTDWYGTVIEESSPAGHTPVLSNTIWANRSFLMTNYSISDYKFPSSLNEWTENYADKKTPYDVTTDGAENKTLNPIKVERVAARIDFRDGSGNTGEKANTYAVMTTLRRAVIGADGTTTETPAVEKNLFNVKLTRMSLVNMSKDFYYLRRVSGTGLAAATPATSASGLCGVETPSTGLTPWVVDVDAEKKNKATATSGGYTATDAGTGFNFCLYNSNGDGTYARENWYTDNIADVLGGAEDNWGGTNKYHIWRYVTENTIPGELNQITVQSTGVVFKGKIMPGEHIATATWDGTDFEGGKERVVTDEVVNALTNVGTTKDASPILYSYNNVLYAGVKGVVAAAMREDVGSPIYASVDNILSSWYRAKEGTEYAYTASPADTDVQLTLREANTILNGTGSTYTIKLDLDGEAEGQFMALAPTPENNITIYKASEEDQDGDGWGYYCYYFYWNRHNDNLKSGEMGKMEFATVRNNVYKLAVTAINQLGHPRITKYDPDPTEEKDPDEPRVRYISVQVDVLPWVVRVNDIEF